MSHLPTLMLLIFGIAPYAIAESSLLESVKRNPNEALALCGQFKTLNTQGISASSKQSIMEVARKRNLSSIDAEILSTYVIGMNCPDVR